MRCRLRNRILIAAALFAWAELLLAGTTVTHDWTVSDPSWGLQVVHDACGHHGVHGGVRFCLGSISQRYVPWHHLLAAVVLTVCVFVVATSYAKRHLRRSTEHQTGELPTTT